MEAFEYDLKYLLALINSAVASDILKLLAPTINFGVEQVGKIPVKIQKKNQIERITDENIETSKSDWDSLKQAGILRYILLCAANLFRRKKWQKMQSTILWI